MSIQASSIIGSNIYQARDAPRYYKANKILIGLIAFNTVVLYPGTYLFYKFTNKRRDRIWNGMSSEEQKEYLRTTKDQGNKRLDFRFDY
jgi:hypothetical protein